MSLTREAVANPKHAEPGGISATGLVLDGEWQSTIASAHGRRDYVLRRLLAFSDMAAIAAGLGVACIVGSIDRSIYDMLWLAPFLAVWFTLFALYGLYSRDLKRIGQGALDDLPYVFHAMLLGTLLMWVYFRLIVPVHPLVMEEVAVFGLTAGALVLVMRFIVRRISARVLGAERVLLIGEAPVTSALVRKMRDHPEYGLEPVGIVAREMNGDHTSSLATLATLASLELDAVVDTHQIDRVIVAQEEVGDEAMMDLLQECGELHLKVSVLPRGVETMGPSMEVDDIEGVTVLGLNPLVLARSSRAIKRAVDLLGAGLGLLLLSPVMLAAAIAIKIDSRGPVLFRQPRIGRRGQLFGVVKFRTMVSNAEELAETLMESSQDPHWLKLDRDPRITRVGRVLRLLSLDELPQLWNVLRGEMSLVGPRPLTALDHDQVGGWARVRLDLAPGITGLWQVLGRTNIPFEEMVKLDFVYVTNWSPWLDLKLLAYTVPAVIQRRGAN